MVTNSIVNGQGFAHSRSSNVNRPWVPVILKSGRAPCPKGVGKPARKVKQQRLSVLVELLALRTGLPAAAPRGLGHVNAFVNNPRDYSSGLGVDSQLHHYLPGAICHTVNFGHQSLGPRKGLGVLIVNLRVWAQICLSTD
ncbi:hypothetical protein J6590_024587 [Homalodisca vitripennis]|nr:hypothetical protein J6590_024587 [Homalodisca vitripennis]